MDMHPAQPFSFPHSGALRRHLKLGLVGALSLAAAYAWWPVHRTAVATFPVKPLSYIPAYFHADTEQAFETRLIGHEIEELIAFAATRNGRSGSPALYFDSGSSYANLCRFEGRIGQSKKVHVAINLKPYLWSPDAYSPWVHALLTSVPARKTFRCDLASRDFPRCLVNPLPELFAREDKRISEALTREPLNPDLHEQAALLLGSLALRDFSSKAFSDQRLFLGRITAHLAIARALTDETGPSGDLAEALLCALVGRETAALTIVNRLEKNAGSPGALPEEVIGPWSRSLRMYLTGDYRLLHPPIEETLLERLEYVRALTGNLSPDIASRFIKSSDLERLPEWGGRIVTENFSVNDGSFWIGRTLGIELEQCATIFRVYHTENLHKEDLTTALNAPWEIIQPGIEGRTAISVLGWGGWANMYQRQICGLLETESIFRGDKRGVAEEADAVENVLAKPFEKLTLFPLIRFYHPNDSSQTETAFLDRARAIASESPGELSFQRATEAMGIASKRISSAPPPIFTRSPKGHRTVKPGTEPVFDKILQMTAWFNPLMPVGTTYDVEARISHGWGDHAALKEYLALAPHNFEIIWYNLMIATRYRPTAEQAQKAYAEISGYNAGAMRAVAETVKDDPARYQELYAPLCALDPENYRHLANYLVDADETEAAARAYEKMVEKMDDRVSVSNSVKWLIDYYLDHGRPGDARPIAEEAANVYSYGGLEAMSWFFERTGDLAGAEEYLQKAKTRYPDSKWNALDYFYLRNREKNADYGKQADAYQSKTFPNGMVQVTLNELQGAPSDGAILPVSTARLSKKNLQSGDIFVAANGYRVHNLAQYRFARAMHNDPQATLIIWRQGNYIAVPANLKPSEQYDSAKMSDYSTLNKGSNL